ncbi:ABC transporter permease, partial [Paenibacillus sepulcri]|nr:ABC transporter permease [Paenibacillus sepulcri]
MKIRALAIRIIRQFLRDKRTLALLFVAPLLILVLMKLVFNGQTVQPQLGTLHIPQQLAAQLAAADAHITVY